MPRSEKLERSARKDAAVGINRAFDEIDTGYRRCLRAWVRGGEPELETALTRMLTGFRVVALRQSLHTLEVAKSLGVSSPVSFGELLFAIAKKLKEKHPSWGKRKGA